MNACAKLAAWLTSLDALSDEINSASEGSRDFDKRKLIEIFKKILPLNRMTVELP
jgi:hypothetical protein